MRQVVRLCAVVALGWSLSAGAQVYGQGWSVLTGKTVGTNENALHFQAGWPGISATLLHGASPTLDLGGIFSFNYGFEGDVRLVWPGFKFQGLVRATLAQSSTFNFGVNFAPGPFFYFHDATTTVGVAIPVEFVFGLPSTSAVNVAFAFDVPMFVYFGNGGQLVLPLLFGGGIEYFFERNLAVTFDLRMGPMIFTSGGASDFAFRALMGIAVKM
jgi:hypothetical protein